MLVNLISNLKSIIARKFIIYILLFSTVITLSGSAVQLYMDYSREIDELNKQLDLVKNSHIPVLVNNLWTFNEKPLNIQLDGIYQLPQVDFIQIKSKTSELYSRGVPNPKLKIYTYALEQNYRSKSYYLGDLIIGINFDGIREHLFKKIILVLATEGVKIFLIAILIFFLFYWLIGQHLFELGIYMRNLDLSNLDKSFKLKKEGPEDELDQVVTSINMMRGNLIEKINEISNTQLDLRESKEKFKLLLERAVDLYFLSDTEGNYIEINSQSCEYLGYSSEELLNMNVSQIDSSFDSDNYKKCFTESKNKNFAVTFDSEFKRKDGSIFSVEVRMGAIQIKGVKYAMSLVRDVTENKKSEYQLKKVRSQLQDIIDSMPSMLITVDQNLKINQWNKEAEKRSDKTIEDVLEYKVSEVLPDLLVSEEQIENVMETGDSIVMEKIKFHERNAYYDITLYPLSVEEASGVVIRIDDVTSRVQIEDMMIQTEKMMSVGGLAAGMAHEINNPLSGILNSAQNLVRRFSPEILKNQQIANEYNLNLMDLHYYMEKRGIIKFIDAIVSSGSRASNIVNNMLQFSRKSNSEFSLVDLPELIKNSVQLAGNDYDLKKAHDFRHIKIIYNFDPQAKEILCVKTEIEQVLLNLLRNAAQAFAESPENTVDIIKFVTQKTEKNIKIKLTDNGPGISLEKQKRIFEPFFTTKAVGEGTGLGLSVSYMIITNNHKGTIEVDSTPGRGTSFIIHLPLPD